MVNGIAPEQDERYRWTSYGLSFRMTEADPLPDGWSPKRDDETGMQWVQRNAREQWARKPWWEKLAIRAKRVRNEATYRVFRAWQFLRHGEIEED